MEKLIKLSVIALLLVGLAGFPKMIYADDPDPDSIDEPEKPATEEGKKLIDAKKFDQAVPHFEKMVKKFPKSANAWNYLAYSNRKIGRFEIALKYYKKALSISPNHKGANEYLGELYLQMGNLPLARKHLAKLKTLCPAGCEEYADLKEEIEAYLKKKPS